MRAEAGVRPLRRDRRARARGRRALLVRRGGRVVLALLAALAVLALAAGLVFAGSADEVAEGVTVAGVDVGGLTAVEARAQLEGTARKYASVPVVFTAGEERFTLRPSALDVRGNWAAAAQEAVARGDGVVPLRGLERLWLRVRGAEVEPAVSAYRPALEYRLTEIASAVNRPAQEAALELRGLEPEIVPGRDGLRLDRDASEAVVLGALAGFERVPVGLPVVRERPKVTPVSLGPVAARVRTMLSGPVELTYGGVSIAFSPRQIARMLELPAGGSTELGIREGAAARRLENLARGVARRPRSADFVLRPNGRVRISPSRNGRELDVGATAQAILAAAAHPLGRTAEAVVAEKEPALTTAAARALGVTRELASYATLYSGTADRIQNLQRGIELLDGARIAPGAVWSFNEFVGPRTEERGFRPAPVILDGEYAEGVGGGVSQIATTVFNAAWEAGIDIAERTAHSLYISRYPTGRDATVNYPDVDLKLRNDTDEWIVIEAAYDESGIVVRLLGGGPQRRVESVPGELRVTGPPGVERVSDPALFVGQKVVADDGEPSRAVAVERIVYQGDSVLARETWTTTYRSEPRIVRVGTKPQPVAPAPPEDEEKKDEERKPTDGKPSAGGGAGDGKAS